MGPFVDKADGVTTKTGLAGSLAPRVRKQGGSFGARSSATAITHDENGYYNVELNTTDTGTLGPLRVASTDAATYVGVWEDFSVIGQEDYDAKYAAVLTMQTGSTSTTAKLAASESATDSLLNSCFLTTTGGTGAGQTRRITDWVGSTKVATVDTAWITTPDNTTTYRKESFGNVSASSNVKKNKALAGFEFLMTDSTAHLPATGRTVAVTRSIDGGAFAAGTLSVVTELTSGIYKVDFAAADLNGNVIVLRATSLTCDDTFERVITTP